MKRWYAVHTIPRAEDRATANLLQQGFEIYLPMVRKTVRHARKTIEVQAPLFPSYLFVALDLGAHAWRAINGTFGVRRLIQNGDVPAPVPHGVVEQLQAEHDSDGLLPLPEPDRVRVGSRVEIIAGSLADQVATILKLSEHERVVVLLGLLGRSVKATLPLSHVRKLA